MLRHVETDQLRYFYASLPGTCMRTQPFIHESFVQQLNDMDPLEYARQQRPNSKWVVDTVTNVLFYVNKMVDTPIWD